MTIEAEIQEGLLDCLDCGAELVLTGAVDLGQRVACPECCAVMEVIGLDPIEVDWVYDEPEYEEREEQAD
jgi:lysine biosynthesis protein LysW